MRTVQVVIPTYVVTVVFHNEARGERDAIVTTFYTERAARGFCREEVKWEKTIHVVCPQIDFDQPGDFA